MESAVAVTSRPNKKNIDAFGAIVNFVNDLWDVFGKGSVVTPLSLYHRLISKINLSDTEGIQKAVSGFKTFFSSNEVYLVANKLENIPRGVVINYGTSDKIVLEIQKFIYQSDPSIKASIRQHLLTISAIIEPDTKKIEQLEKRLNDLNVDTNTAEGKFISNIMEKAKTGMSSIDTNDPTQAMMAIFQSGVIQEMIGGLQNGVTSGQMDIRTLMSTMQSAIGAIIPAESDLPSEKSLSIEQKTNRDNVD